MSELVKQYSTIKQKLNTLGDELKSLVNNYHYNNGNKPEAENILDSHISSLEDIKKNFEDFLENNAVFQDSIIEAESYVDFYDQYIKKAIEDFNIDKSVLEIENFDISNENKEVGEDNNQSIDSNHDNISDDKTESETSADSTIYISKGISNLNDFCYTPMTKSSSKKIKRNFS